MELKDQLAALQAELKAHFEKAAEQQKQQGAISLELKTQIEKIQKQVDAIDVKMAERHTSFHQEKSLSEFLNENEALKKFMKDRPKTGSVTLEFDAKMCQQFERKTTIDSAAVGRMTSGVLAIDRTSGIVAEARQTLTMRDALTSRPTTMQVLDFVKVNSPLSPASPQIEASAKTENAVTFTTASERVRTIATWIPATRQVLDDMDELSGYLLTGLPYAVNLKEETQILSGDGLTENLNGLITQATAFDTNLLSGVLGWNTIDIIGRAIQQITAAKELAPTFVVLHPTDWWGMRLTKDDNGLYIMGPPMSSAGRSVTGGTVGGSPDLFNLTPIVTTSITAGTFLVGSGSPVACEIRDRMGMTVEIATEHSDYFTKNMVAIRAEKRLALVVYRPASFIHGSLTTSP